MKPEKKPPKKVVTIGRDCSSQDVITQSDLGHIGDLQATEWIASQATQREVLSLDQRLKAGAVIEDGPLTFDLTLRMVRRKQAKEGSA